MDSKRQKTESDEEVEATAPIGDMSSAEIVESIISNPDNQDEHLLCILNASSDDDLDEGEEGELDEEDDEDDWQDELIEEMEKALDYKGESFTPEGVPLLVMPADIVKEIRADLFTSGPLVFTAKYLIQSREYTPGELLSALGFRLPLPVIEKYTSSQLALMLQIAMRHVLSKRQRLDSPRTINEVVELIKNAKNIIVLTGAGISTSLGIPDFRSDNGLYAQLEHLGLTDPQEVFDINLFREDPRIFYSIARKVLPESTKFSPTHRFIKMLDERGKLLRNYTQNIDNLEHYAGLAPEKLVQCHGSFGMARCMSCSKQIPGESIYTEIREGIVPKCPDCAKKRKRMEDDENSYGDESFGVFKPEITFFGESLPDRFEDMLVKQGDARNCDLLICLGTSLKVAPVSEIVKIVGHDVPQVYISKTPAKHLNFDVSMLGSCDQAIELLCDLLQWPIDHEMVTRPSGMSEDRYPGGTIVGEDGVYKFVPDEEEVKNEITQEEAIHEVVEEAAEAAIEALEHSTAPTAVTAIAHSHLDPTL